MKLRNREGGFTLIELVVIVIIIGILGTLVATTYSGVKAKDRNANRQAEIKTLQAELETYYAQHDKYPTLANLNDANWRSKNMKDLDSENLQDPSWKASVNACTQHGKATVSSSVAAKCYTYQVTTSDAGVCTNTGADCAQYTLTANLEGGEKFVKSSLN